MQAIIPMMALQVGTAFSQRGLQRSSGKIADRQAEIDAKQEELGAIQREGDRKSRLVEAMASQIASAGTKGISAFEGSPLTILEADIEKEETATERDVFQTRLAAMTKRSQGKLSKSLAKRGADIDFVSNIAGTGLQGAQAASVLGGKK